ncbi:MAG: PaaI family thioesterase [Pseudomonadota bacterium]
MIHKEKLPSELIQYLENHKDIDFNRFEIPPPVFTAMKAEVLSFDLERRVFCCKFPVLTDYFNPYGVIQGGIISAAIDNTIGPLSMLVAPPSLTRKLEVKFYEAIEASNEFFQVMAKFVEQKKRFLYFEAEVENLEKNIKFASAKATHWIV